jgi:acetyl-CoA carboxylase biotin carboxyl carrier protein
LDLTRITSLSDLEQLLELLGRYDIHEIEIQSENQKLRISAKSRVDASSGVVWVAPPAGYAPGQPPAAGHGAAAAAGSLEALDSAELITSPMVGTFYRAPSPEADPFVQVGDRIESDTVLCIIEAMKVMNEIKAELAGEILEILVNNAEAVEFDQPLFLVRPTEH